MGKNWFSEIGSKMGLIEEEPQAETPVATPAVSTPLPQQPVRRVNDPANQASTQFDINTFSSPVASNIIPATDPQKESAAKELFQKILDTANMDGLDYFEFRQALNSLREMGDTGMNEVQEYRSVFVTFKTQGCDVTRLIESANFYLSTLEKKKSEIEDAIKQKRSQEVDDVKSQIELLDQENLNLNKQIEDLRKQVSDNQEEIFKLTNQIDTNTRSLSERESLVNSEYIRVTDDIRKDIQRIQQYLSAPSAKSPA